MAWPESTRLRDAWQEVTSELAGLTQRLLRELLPEQGRGLVRQNSPLVSCMYSLNGYVWCWTHRGT